MKFTINPVIMKKTKNGIELYDIVRYGIIIVAIVSFLFIADYLYADTSIVQAEVVDKSIVYDEDWTYYYLYINTKDKVSEAQTDKGNYMDVAVGDFIDVEKRTTKTFGINYFNY